MMSLLSMDQVDLSAVMHATWPKGPSMRSACIPRTSLLNAAPPSSLQLTSQALMCEVFTIYSL